jgi:hypothetical protein
MHFSIIYVDHKVTWHNSTPIFTKQHIDGVTEIYFSFSLQTTNGLKKNEFKNMTKLKCSRTTFKRSIKSSIIL